ncbi:MAG: ComF family protein [Pedobacter sp.]|nr:MAG: ComF family protein [Pedobacter sp.]
MLDRAMNDLFGLLFPDLCNGCGNRLIRGEQELCTLCYNGMPYTDFHLFKDNRVARQLWGRANVDAAMAMLYFKKSGMVQQMMHNLKYRDSTSLGILLGKLIGIRLLESPDFNAIDLVLPVPLHKKKLKSRGYNQSLFIASGIAGIIGSPYNDDNLIREKETGTQTRRSRYLRYENMRSVFSVRTKSEIKEKHILLVDDVLTTGSTLEACSNELLSAGALKISIATAAFSE